MRSFCSSVSYFFASSLTSNVEEAMTASSADVSSWFFSFFSFCESSCFFTSSRY